ncbi:MAG: SWIB/MDM2 domain-containing protein [Rhodoferax sp.]|nr:SWIB/MDM2 domain-containing protein [Rhodoferax sp.]
MATAKKAPAKKATPAKEKAPAKKAAASATEAAPAQKAAPAAKKKAASVKAVKAVKTVVAEPPPATAKKAPAKKAAAKKAAPVEKAAPVAAAPAAAPEGKRKVNAAFMKALTPSAALAAIVGANPLPRTEVIKQMWAYIKENKLQDAVNKKLINADAKLKEVFGKVQVTMFEMAGLIGKHLK